MTYVFLVSRVRKRVVILIVVEGWFWGRGCVGNGEEMVGMEEMVVGGSIGQFGSIGGGGSCHSPVRD